MILNEQHSFVIYKNPFSDSKYIRKGKWEKYTNEVHGFIIESFDEKESYILQEEEEEILEEKLTITPPKSNSTELEQSKEEYITQLESFISACKNSGLDKVISSRYLKHNRSQPIDLFELFIKLGEENPNAFVYLLNIPSLGMWMGATPETLLNSSSKKTYTMALVGSQKSDALVDWKPKEIKEHQYVIDDITQKLSNKNIKYEVLQTENLNAGKVTHLKTEIVIKTHDHSLIKIAKILHPTSAICGMPKEKAKAFILNNENYNREFYAGFLGSFNTETANIYVNLRCMRVFDTEFFIYVGGGITKDSVAEKEWEETELKSRTLLSIIEKM